MAIPFQFSVFDNGKELFVWSNGCLDPVLDFFIGNVIFVRDAHDISVASHLNSLGPLLSVLYCRKYIVANHVQFYPHDPTVTTTVLL